MANAERDGGSLYCQQFAVRRVGSRLKAWNIPVTTQVADAARLEAMTVCRGAALAIEDAGDHAVGVMKGETADERDRVLVGADGGRPRARERQVDLVERAAFPAQREVRGSLVTLDLDDDLLDQRLQQLLPVARRRRRGVPHARKIGPEREQAAALLWGEQPRTLPLAARKLGLGSFESA